MFVFFSSSFRLIIRAVSGGCGDHSGVSFFGSVFEWYLCWFCWWMGAFLVGALPAGCSGCYYCNLRVKRTPQWLQREMRKRLSRWVILINTGSRWVSAMLVRWVNCFYKKISLYQMVMCLRERIMKRDWNCGESCKVWGGERGRRREGEEMSKEICWWGGFGQKKSTFELFKRNLNGFIDAYIVFTAVSNSCDNFLRSDMSTGRRWRGFEVWWQKSKKKSQKG